jgi:azurin
MTKKQIEKLYTQLSSDLESTLMSFEGKKLTPAKKIKALKAEIKKTVDKTYNKLSKNMVADLTKLSDKSYLKGLINVKKTDIIKEEARKLANEIVGRKVAGKTITKRLTINFSKIKKDCLKIVKTGLNKGKS